MTRFSINFSLIVLAFSLSTAAYSFNPAPFNPEKFKSAQESGKVVLVDVYAKWCPTCKRQHADLKELLKEAKYKDIVLFQIDYDQKDDVKNFQKLIEKPIPRQSTIVIYKGSKLAAFSVAETGDALKKQVDKAFE